MRNMYCRQLLVIFSFIFAAAVTTQSDDYEAFAGALNHASTEVNKRDMPRLLYDLDQRTAEQYFQKYFT